MSKHARLILLARAFDLLVLPLVLLAGVFLKSIRRIGLQRLPASRKLLLRIGVLPVRKHYYEPFIDPGDLRRPLSTERRLPGVDWNIAEQLRLLEELRYEHELAHIAAPR